MDAGTGDNVYIIGDDDTGITLLTADVIAAFVTGADTLSLGATGSSTTFVASDGDDDAGTATVFADALIQANVLFDADAGDLLYALVSDGATDAQSWLFEDTDGDGDADLVIVLTGLTSSDLISTDIVA
jgi:hypothetical protein